MDLKGVALALLVVSMPLPARSAAPRIAATVDTDERQTTPVPHRYIHGVIPDDAKFQLALPENWNGKLAIFSRGFSGTELTTGSFKTTALEKGYAFAASDEGWNRLTMAIQTAGHLLRIATAHPGAHPVCEADPEGALRQGTRANADDGRLERRAPHQVDGGELSRTCMTAASPATGSTHK